jgi:hypothetical protein
MILKQIGGPPYIDKSKFNYPMIKAYMDSHKTEKIYICINCGQIFEKTTPHLLLRQHFGRETFRCAIDVEKEIIVDIYHQTTIYHSLFIDFVFMQLKPLKIEQWLSQCFLQHTQYSSTLFPINKRYTFEMIKVTTGRLHTGMWYLYHLLPFLYLLPRDIYFSRHIQKENSNIIFNISHLPQQ